MSNQDDLKGRAKMLYAEMTELAHVEMRRIQRSYDLRREAPGAVTDAQIENEVERTRNINRQAQLEAELDSVLQEIAKHG